MFSQIERDRMWSCAAHQLRADRAERLQPQAQVAESFADITDRPFFQQSIEILCDALTHERCSRLNEAGTR